GAPRALRRRLWPDHSEAGAPRRLRRSALCQRLRRPGAGSGAREGARARGTQEEAGESMNKTRDTKRLVVGLDIGTSKISVIVAELKPEGGFQVIGIGNHPSRGLKKGVVVNIESTVNAIQRALEEAELMADCKIREVYTG